MKTAKEFVQVNYQMKIDSTYLSENVTYGFRRGGIFFKEDRWICPSCELVENENNFSEWIDHEPIAFGKKPRVHELWDLSLPFLLYKESNSDTLVIVKDGFTLKFLLQHCE